MIYQKYIFWDWNGTLLNDAEICLHVMNDMLTRRNMPVLSLNDYKEVFDFPVIEYYRKIGFNFEKESFEDLSVEFISEYSNTVKSANLADGALSILGKTKKSGVSNVIISAMEHDKLVLMVKEHGLKAMFTDILGIGDIYAESKSHIALDYVKLKKLCPEDILFVGDTQHDYEVATEIGCRCILVASGHQSKERLMKTGAVVIESLAAFMGLII